jgi:magnesium chelatase family protein
MKIAKAHSAHLIGLEIQRITAEIDISNGLHSFSIIGLGDRSVEEAKDRISAAIKNSGYISPKQKNQKVIISLAPADVRKEGTSFDVAMAMAYLKASGDIDFEYEHTLFLGELSLEGNIRKVSGVLPMLIQASKIGFTTAFISKENSNEATLAQGIIIYVVDSLNQIIRHLDRSERLEPLDINNSDGTFSANTKDGLEEHEISYIRGNESAKRALEIAVAGFHNIILYGPPGTGKTMLAKSALSIVPALSRDHAIEVTSIYSIAHALEGNLLTRAPFRAPHHTSSAISILGGGQHIRPGEVTLAHRGILFLDEFPEFDRDVIDGLRQPLEDKTIAISRARGSVLFPAQCMLIASMNPCRCGKQSKECSCSRKSIEMYRNRLSAPILDRIDMWIEVSDVDYDKLASPTREVETSRDIRKRIEIVREVQAQRFSSGTDSKKVFNSEMSAKDIEMHARLNNETRDIIRSYAARLGFSARAFHRVIKVARTIADLDRSKDIQKRHLLEALQYRQKAF